MEEEKTIPQNEESQEIQEQSSNTRLSVVLAKKSLKKGLLVSIVIVVITLTAILLFSNSGSIHGEAEPKLSAIVARMTDDGTAYIPLFDGTCIEINDEVKWAVLTADRKYVIVWLQDGTLYVTNPELSVKNTITDDCSSILRVNSDGFFYLDKDNSIYRCLFADYSSVKLGKYDRYTFAENNATVLYSTADGKVYTLASSAAEPTRVGSSSDSIKPSYISDDGQLSLWITGNYAASSWSIILNDGDDRITLGDVNYDYSETYATFSKDQKTMVISDKHSNKMWIKMVGEDPITVKLPTAPEHDYDSIIYTENGRLADENSADITALYITTESDSTKNLYRISMDGDRERVLSKVWDFAIAKGKLFYINEDHSLYYADLHGSEISNEVKIASDVVTFEVTDNGKFIYYAKDYEITGSFWGAANLYCYKIGDEEPVRIASNVVTYAVASVVSPQCSTDGATIFFFKDVEYINITDYVGSTSELCGTLMKWSYGTEDAEKIASEAVMNSLWGEFASGAVDPTSVVYMKYAFHDGDKHFANWMYYNGEESTKIVSDIVYAG